MSANDAITIFNAGVEAAKPARLMPQYLHVENNSILAGKKEFLLDELDGVYLLSVGKAASAMALEVEKVLGNKIKAGLVVTKYGHALQLKYCGTIEAGHPVPDENSVAAAKVVVSFLQQLNPASLLVCCISGGASALLGDFAEGISLADMQQLSTLLLQCGADIQEINTVRKHFSTLKGGQLSRYANNASLVSFIISDVLGDDVSVIASGLTVADASTFNDVWKVIGKYSLADKIPASINTILRNGLHNVITETPKPGDEIFGKVYNNVVGTNNTALQAATLKAHSLIYEVHIINNALQGEARIEAKKIVDELLHYKGPKPACLLMGGETTVTIQGNGKGGRNQHFVLAALCELVNKNLTPAEMPVILSGGTDGTDGPTDAAGAFVDANVFINMQKLNLDPFDYLGRNDAYHFFEQTGGLVITGPTQTNVMDIVIGLI